MSGAGEVKPSQGPKGPTRRELREADARARVHSGWSNEAEGMSGTSMVEVAQ